MRRSLQIVELTVVHGPDEGPDRGAQKKDRKGDQYEDDRGAIFVVTLT